MRGFELLRFRFVARAGRHASALTLVEVLVAITIGALLLGSVVSSTRTVAESRKRVEERAARTAEARRAMDLILGSLRNVRRDVVDRKIPLILGRNGGPGGSGRIDMQVMSEQGVRADSPESDQQEVAFFLQTPGDGRLPSLMCRRDHGLDDHMDDGGIVTAVAHGIVGLNFEYFYEGEWYPDWPATRPLPPQAIRLTLVAATDIDPRLSRGQRTIPDVIVLSSAMAIHVSQQPEENDQSQSNQQDQKPRGKAPSPGGAP